MKTYKYEDWDFEWAPGKEAGGFDDRIYIDNEGHPVTGMLEGFYCYSGTTSTRHPKNCQYVENGKRIFK